MCWMTVHISTFCRLLLFFEINFIKKYFCNTIKVLNSMDSDQSPKCLQMLSADDNFFTVENVSCKFIHYLLSTCTMSAGASCVLLS